LATCVESRPVSVEGFPVTQQYHDRSSLDKLVGCHDRLFLTGVGDICWAGQRGIDYAFP